MSKKIDLTGMRFGRLVVLHEDGRSKNGHVLWRCKCDCGGEVTVSSACLRKGKSCSCGCLKREKFIERITRHGLQKSHLRLYESVRNHFKLLRKGRNGYQNWSLDARYSDDMNGVVKFCHDLLALQPDACARYEEDITLDLDKDNDSENVFKPESIVFRPSTENRSKHCDNIKLDDGRPLAEFCRKVGILTRENSKWSRQYRRIYRMYCKHHKAHPELVQKANEIIALYTKTLKMVKLLEDARRFASLVDDQKLLQTSNPESV